MVGWPGIRTQRPRAIEGHAMVAALDGVAAEPSHGEGGEAVRAGVLERGDRSRTGAIEHDALPENAPRRQRVNDIARPGRRVPGIANIFIHGGFCRVAWFVLIYVLSVYLIKF